MSKIYLAFKGLSEASDNADRINRVIETSKDKDVLVFPYGKFPVNKSLVQNNKGLRWESSEETDLLFNHSGVALTLKRSASTSRTFIEKINFLSRFNGTSTEQHGIVSGVPITMKNFIIENFHGDGVRLIADVTTSPAADVSFTHAESLIVRSCINGIWLQAGDSNAGTFLHIDTRDNSGYGIYDASFLGNSYVGCMGHYNKKGNYAATGVNNRSTYLGCYSEEGYALSYFHGCAEIFGGLWGGGVALEHNARAHIDGTTYDAQNNRYDVIGNDIYKGQMFKIFKRNKEPFEYQWRVYINQDGDQFEEKSYETIVTQDECVKGAKSYIDNKHTK